MKITLISLGSTGDIRPMILLGRELEARGHKITIGGFSDFRELVTRAGLGFRAIAGDTRDFMAHIMSPNAAGPAYLKEVERALAEIAPRLLDDLLAACDGADALICSFFGSMFYSVAEYYHIPCIQIQYALMDPNSTTPICSAPGLNWGTWWNLLSYRLGYFLISLLEKKYLSAWRARHGLRQRSLYTRPDYSTPDGRIPVIYEISEALVPKPKEFGPEVLFSGFWKETETLDYQPSPALQQFLADGDTPIYVGFGSMVSGDMTATLQTVVRSVEKAGLRAILSLGWAEGADPGLLSDRFFLEDQVPHSWLFSQVSAVVHHGGAGTTYSGLLAGKPTLVIPFGSDQPFWGQRVHAVGCGPKPLHRNKMTEDALALRLRELTEHTEYAENARRISKVLQQENGLQLAADRIEKELGL